jgi:hypothetical protein
MDVRALPRLFRQKAQRRICDGVVVPQRMAHIPIDHLARVKGRWPVCVSCVIHDLAMVFGCGNAPMQVGMGKDSVRM